MSLPIATKPVALINETLHAGAISTADVVAAYPPDQIEGGDRLLYPIDNVETFSCQLMINVPMTNLSHSWLPIATGTPFNS